MKQRNVGIDCLKFWYVGIVILSNFFSSSSKFLPAGAYGIDFLFVVSGALFFNNLGDETPETAPDAFFLKRFARLFPWTFTAFLATAFVSRAVISQVSGFERFFRYFTEDIWEILMIKMGGINQGSGLLNYTAWMISAALIAQFVMYCFIYSNQKRFFNAILPISILIGTGWFINLESRPYSAWITFTTVGVLRAWFEMGIGYYSVLAARHMEKMPLTHAGELALTILELLIHAAALLIILWRSSPYNLLLIVLLFSISTAIELSGHSLFCRILNHIHVLKFVGTVSFSAFLLQAPLLRLFRKLYPFQDGNGIDPDRVWLYIGVTLAAAIAHLIVTKLLIVLSKGIGHGFKAICLKQAPETNPDHGQESESQSAREPEQDAEQV